jgi:hypothetical protein
MDQQGHRAVQADGRPDQRDHGTEMVDPTTRQKVGASDIPEVILEQIENFDDQVDQGLQGPASSSRVDPQPVLAAHRGVENREAARSRT